MQINWITISEKVIIEKETENPSLINIFTNTKTAQLPLIHRFVLSANITEGKIGEKITVVFLDPENVQVGNPNEFILSSSEMNVYVNVQVELKKVGMYTIQLLESGLPIAKTKLFLERVEG